MKKLLFFDIDGTLLSMKTRNVPLSAIEAIKQAQSLGHLCYFCTGRSYEMRRELDYLKIPNAIICNGAGIIMNDQLVYADAIDDEVIRKTLQLIEDLHGGVQILDASYGYQNETCHQGFAEMFAERFPEMTVEDVFKQKGMKRLDEYTGTPVLKLDYTFDTADQAQYFLDHLDPSLGYIDQLSYFRGKKPYGEIMRKGVNKGEGVKHVVELTGLSINNTYGFGDSANDREMLETCHTAIVMGDGQEALKAKADFVTKTVEEDGIAYAMKKLHII